MVGAWNNPSSATVGWRVVLVQGGGASGDFVPVGILAPAEETRRSALELWGAGCDTCAVEEHGGQLVFALFPSGPVALPSETEPMGEQAGSSRPLRSGRDEELGQRARQRCRALGLALLADRVTVRWNPRMRSSAGRASWPGALIELNPALEALGEGEVHRTFLHELAHLVAFERAGRRRIKPHGPQWRRACAELGIPGETASHRLALPSRTMRRRWVYECPVCRGRFERVRRMRGHTACWSCCRQHAGGKYDERFRLVEARLGD